jgi:hypothetical protein
MIAYAFGARPSDGFDGWMPGFGGELSVALLL